LKGTFKTLNQYYICILRTFSRLKNLEDEWQFIESSNDGTEEPADPHMSTPKPSPSPTPQSTTEHITETEEIQIDDRATDQPKITNDNTDITEENVDQKEKEEEKEIKENDVLVESPKLEETPEVTAGK
jgi:hypothetical protein